MTRSISDIDVRVGMERLTGNPLTSNPLNPRAVFVYDVDGTVYQCDQPTLTGAQIMTAAGLDPQQGLIHLLNDGSRVTVAAAETVNLAAGAHFKRRPRFKRG